MYTQLCSYLSGGGGGAPRISKEKMAQIAAKIEADRKILEEKTDMAEEDRNKVKEDLEMKEEELRKYQYVLNCIGQIANNYQEINCN